MEDHILNSKIYIMYKTNVWKTLSLAKSKKDAQYRNSKMQ